MLLAFDDDGPGPVVVLLHGFPLDRSMWSFQRSSVGSIYRLITFDLRGHGSTAAPDGVYSIDGMADDVIETLDGLQLTGPVVIGGLSMGGYVALSVAARYPDRLKALMLINSRAAADSPEARAIRLDLADKVEAGGDVEAVVAGMVPRIFARSTIEHHPEIVARTHARMSKTPARAIVGALRGMAERPDRSADLAAITVPTLILAGAEDQIVPVEEARAMAGSLRNGWFAEIPGSAHLAPLENHHATDTAILGFLETQW